MKLFARTLAALAALCLAASPAVAQNVRQPGSQLDSINIVWGAYGAASHPITVADPLPTQCITGCASAVPFTFTGDASLAVTTSTARVALANTDTVAILTNNGTSDLYWKLGNSSITAATTDHWLGTGRSTVTAVAAGQTNIAAITASGTAALVVTQGTGGPTLSGGGGSGAGASAKATAAAPTYSEATTVNLSTDLAGNLRVMAILADSSIATNLATIAANSGGQAPGLAPVVSASAESCHVLKASPGTLYSVGGYAGQAEWIMVLNATGAPGDGAVTPVAWGYAAAAGSWGMSWPVPLVASTGITVCYSSTGPFTKTAISTNNAFSGQVQ